MATLHTDSTLHSRKTTALLSRGRYIIPLILVLTFSLLTLARNYNWFSETKVWGEVAVSSPSKARAQTRLAVASYKDGDYDNALDAAVRANAIYNFYPDAHYVAGLVSWRRGDNETAIEELSWALMLVERFTENTGYASDIHNALGRAYGDDGKFNMAIMEFERALILDPNHERARANIKIMKEAAL